MLLLVRYFYLNKIYVQLNAWVDCIFEFEIKPLLYVNIHFWLKKERFDIECSLIKVKLSPFDYLG